MTYLNALKNFNDVLFEINNAFTGVTLGTGIGLQEAEALDNFMIGEYCAECRLKDEKLDWRNITAENLNENWSSLSHFDAEGMRFHLPAYMLLDLNHGYHFDLIITLTEVGQYRKSQFELFNCAQKSAVAAYLIFKINDARTLDADIPEIHKALSEYWLLDSPRAT